MIVKVKGKDMLIDATSLPLFKSRVWHINDMGYVVWRGVKDNVKQTLRFHRLVIRAKPNQIVDHINRNKLDNRLENLRICSQKENVHNSDHFERAKLYYYDKRKKRWTVEAQRFGIRSVYVDSEEAALKYIAELKLGKNPEREFQRRPSLGGAKLTTQDREAILQLFKEGKKRYQIARQFNLSPSTVGRLLAGKTWAKSRRGKKAD